MIVRKIKDSAPRNDENAGYEVGYGRPPQHGQFRPGQSGNPTGRPKGLNNLRTDVKRTLEIPVRVQEGGRSRRISTQRGALMRLRENALQGNPRALDRFLDLAFRFNNEAAEITAQSLSPDDNAILADYRAELLADALQATPTMPPKQHRVKRKPRSATSKRETPE